MPLKMKRLYTRPRRRSVVSLTELQSAWRELVQLGLQVDSAGSLSRLGSMRRLLLPGQKADGFDGRVLVDYNAGKLAAARDVWSDISYVNPFNVRPSQIERVCLLLSLFLRDVPRRALQAVGVAVTVGENKGQDASLFLWNPYSMFHFGIDEVLGSSGVVVVTPEYPLPRRAGSIIAPEVVREMYDMSDKVFEPMRIHHKFVRDDPLLAIYLSKLLPEKNGWVSYAEFRQARRIENRLVRFGIEMARLGVPIEFFLHYSERSKVGVNALPEGARPFANLADSLTSLSSRQIAISGSSTIGIKLASLGIAHAFVFTISDGERTPYTGWADSQPNRLDVGATDEAWVDLLYNRFPSEAAAVLGVIGGR